MGISAPHYRFTIDDYYRMAESGILTEDDRVELIDGEIVEMTPIGARHASVVDRLNHLLTVQLGEDAIVRIQNPVRLSNDSEPEPDVAILRARPDFYASGHPGSSDILLIVEVMESSKAYDRTVKLPLYARHRIPELWLIDLEAETIEVFSAPEEDSYSTSQTHPIGAPFQSATIPNLHLSI